MNNESIANISDDSHNLLNKRKNNIYHISGKEHPLIYLGISSSYLILKLKAIIWRNESKSSRPWTSVRDGVCRVRCTFLSLEEWEELLNCIDIHKTAWRHQPAASLNPHDPMYIEPKKMVCFATGYILRAQFFRDPTLTIGQVKKRVQGFFSRSNLAYSFIYLFFGCCKCPLSWIVLRPFRLWRSRDEASHADLLKGINRKWFLLL